MTNTKTTFDHFIASVTDEISPNEWNRMQDCIAHNVSTINVDTENAKIRLNYDSEKDAVSIQDYSPNNKEDSNTKYTRLHMTDDHRLQVSYPMNDKHIALLIGQRLDVINLMAGSDQAVITQITSHETSCYVQFKMLKGPYTIDQLNIHDASSWEEKLRLERVAFLHGIKFHPLSADIIERMEPSLRQNFDDCTGRFSRVRAHEIDGIHVGHPGVKFTMTLDGAAPDIEIGNHKIKKARISAGPTPEAIKLAMVGKPARNIVDHPVLENYVVSKTYDKGANTYFAFEHKDGNKKKRALNISHNPQGNI